MALDSQAKRMAAAGAGRPYMRATLASNLGRFQRYSIGNTYLATTAGLILSGIATGEAFGATVLVGSVSILPNSIATAEAFGTASLTTGVVSILPTGIESGESFGIAIVGDIVIVGDYDIVVEIVSNLVSNIVTDGVN